MKYIEIGLTILFKMRDNIAKITNSTPLKGTMSLN